MHKMRAKNSLFERPITVVHTENLASKLYCQNFFLKQSDHLPPVFSLFTASFPHLPSSSVVARGLHAKTTRRLRQNLVDLYLVHTFFHDNLWGKYNGIHRHRILAGRLNGLSRGYCGKNSERKVGKVLTN